LKRSGAPETDLLFCRRLPEMKSRAVPWLRRVRALFGGALPGDQHLPLKGRYHGRPFTHLPKLELNFFLWCSNRGAPGNKLPGIGFEARSVFAEAAPLLNSAVEVLNFIVKQPLFLHGRV
jgi:hypothetical protein